MTGKTAIIIKNPAAQGGNMVVTDNFQIKTKGNCDIIDITEHISKSVHESGLSNGTVTVFVAHSTCGISTIEYEPGLVSDMQELFNRIAPQGIPYGHDKRWGDGNGHSHVRATLLGGSFVIPFSSSELILGTWQQVILIDFDNRSRTRSVVIQLMGE